MRSPPGKPGGLAVASRRRLLKTLGVAAGAALVAPRLAAQGGHRPGPPSVITNPPRISALAGAPTTYFSDRMSSAWIRRSMRSFSPQRHQRL